MARKEPKTIIRVHRRHSELSQRELAEILGSTEAQVSRHERGTSLPLLRTAIGYAALFRMPLAELFPDIHAAVTGSIETRLAELERRLQAKGAKGRSAQRIARKLEWTCGRKNAIEI